MNSDQARDLLLEYAYGELDASTAEAVREAIEADPALAAEYEQIACGRAAWSVYAAAEPAEAPQPLPAETPAPSRRRWVWPLVAATAAAAAAVVLALGPFTDGTGPGGGNGGGFLDGRTAHAAAPTIRRTDLAVTILSEPDERNIAARWAYLAEHHGLALVRDGRIAADLPPGVSTVELTGIPAGIVPASVQMAPQGRPRGLTVLEQNYQYDLATAERVLRRYIDSEITVVLAAADAGAPEAEGVVAGRLLAAGAETLVLAVDGAPRAINRRKVRAIRFGELPEGLRSRPTLVWKVRNAAGRRQRFTVSYLTGGLKWRADYNLTLRDPHPQAVRRTEPKTGLAYVEYFDTIDLAGWATVENRSGVRLPDARLKLLAGDVRLIAPNRPPELDGSGVQEALPASGMGLGGFAEKAFFEYHLYTLGRATTLADRQVKQLALTAGRGMRARRRYVYRESLGAGPVRVISELLNSEQNGLGRPLPKGVVRLWAPDADGLAQQAGQTEIDHTPRDETLTFQWGTAFDITAESEHLHAHNSATTVRRDRRLTLHNAKAVPVTVTVVLDVPRTTYQVDCPLPWHAPQVGRIEIDVPLDPGQRRELTYHYTFDTDQAGWVQSPYPPRPELKTLIENTERTGTTEPGADDRATDTEEMIP